MMKNEICNFTKIIDEYNEHSETIYITLFKKYNDNYYSDWINFHKKYLSQLKYFNEILKKNNIILYIDNIIYNNKYIMKKLLNVKINIYLFDCKKFKINDDYHYKLFGTFIRFFPLFDFELEPHVDNNIAYVSDFDSTIRSHLFFNFFFQRICFERLCVE